MVGAAAKAYSEISGVTFGAAIHSIEGQLECDFGGDCPTLFNDKQ